MKNPFIYYQKIIKGKRMRELKRLKKEELIEIINTYADIMNKDLYSLQERIIAESVLSEYQDSLRGVVEYLLGGKDWDALSPQVKRIVMFLISANYEWSLGFPAQIEESMKMLMADLLSPSDQLVISSFLETGISESITTPEQLYLIKRLDGAELR